MNEQLSTLDGLAQFETEMKPFIDRFQEKLNIKPDAKIIKVNNGVKYIPIEIIEALMDKLFGIWEITNLHYSIEVNATVVSLDVKVLHPIAKVWITRSGIGSVPVQLDRQTKEIKPMALQKNLPHAKAIAFKNACQSLGRSFGRNINRGWDIPFKSDTSNFTQIFNENENS